ncbi:MAG: glutamate synthase central domain-containing protein, partial [Gemmatimonadota bacterium]
MRQSVFESMLERGACGVGFVARVSGRPDHALVRTALEAVSCLEHRGAVAADGKSGDGAGILTQIPRRLLAREVEQGGLKLRKGERLGIGMLFLPRGDVLGQRAMNSALEAQGLRVLGWRLVPVDAAALGEAARATLPDIRQVLVAGPAGTRGAVFEQHLYLAQKSFERARAPGYICSLSARTIVYKALCGAHQIPRFYTDLNDPLYQSALAVYHQRYSTNTLPSWEMAQPFRMLAHNGEINTLWGNRAWMRVREAELPPELCPVLTDGQSDSAALDAALQLMRRTGRDITHALSMLITPAWEETSAALSTDVRAFYHAHAPLIEPWDGPAAVSFCDGRVVGAALDRNGLRPCRYKITADGMVVAGSEAGVVDLDDEQVISKGRLGPGEMLAVDVVRHRILHNAQIRRRLTRYSAPRWAAVHLSTPELSTPATPVVEQSVRRALGLSQEDVKIVVAAMAEDEKDAVWSMGDDAPIPPLSQAPHAIYSFLRQRFAQVTNPPIDPLREAVVMSLRTWLGPRPPLVALTTATPLIELESPILTSEMAAALRAQHEIPLAGLDCTFDAAGDHLLAAIDRIATQAEAAVQADAGLLVLTDRGVNAQRAAVPMPLVVGAVHHRLVAARLRARAGLIVEAGDCWDTHHAAVLIACGGTVVWPWLALSIARELDAERGEERLMRTLCAGLRTVMSKMGISTVASYRGAQQLEALGLAQEIVDHCFEGMPTAIGGLGFDALTAAVLARHAAAFGAAADEPLPDHGRARFRRADHAEHHAWNPIAVRALQDSVGSGRRVASDQQSAWREFRQIANQPVAQLRDLLEFAPAAPPVAVDVVEDAASIARRFITSAMSLGALSPEAHATLTIAMNRLGARSNSGEGGENPELYENEPGGDRRDNKI